MVLLDDLYNNDVDLSFDDTEPYSSDGNSNVSDDSIQQTIHEWVGHTQGAIGTPGEDIPIITPPSAPETLISVSVPVKIRSIVTDFDIDHLEELDGNGAIFYVVYDDGSEEICDYTEVVDPYVVMQRVTTSEVYEITSANNQHFWYDDNGAHVTDETRDSWEENVAYNFSDLSDNNNHHNLLMNSYGLVIRRALKNLAAFSRSGVTFYDGNNNNVDNIVALFGTDSAQIGKSSESHVSLTSYGIDFYKNSQNIASFGLNGARIGPSTETHMSLTNSGIDFYKNNQNVASFGSDGARVGASTESNVSITDVSFKMDVGNGFIPFEIRGGVTLNEVVYSESGTSYTVSSLPYTYSNATPTFVGVKIFQVSTSRRIYIQGDFEEEYLSSASQYHSKYDNMHEVELSYPKETQSSNGTQIVINHSETMTYDSSTDTVTVTDCAYNRSIISQNGYLKLNVTNKEYRLLTPEEQTTPLRNAWEINDGSTTINKMIWNIAGRLNNPVYSYSTKPNYQDVPVTPAIVIDETTNYLYNYRNNNSVLLRNSIASIDWPGGANLVATASANNQEWSIDLNPNGYTGTYWHVWTSAKSTILRCDVDSGRVTMPYEVYSNTRYNLKMGGIQRGVKPSAITYGNYEVKDANEKRLSITEFCCNTNGTNELRFYVLGNIASGDYYSGIVIRKTFENTASANMIYNANTGNLNLAGSTSTSFISAKDKNTAAITINKVAVTDGSRYDSIIAGTSADSSTWSIGVINKAIRIGGYDSGQTNNSFTRSFTFDLGNGHFGLDNNGGNIYGGWDTGYANGIFATRSSKASLVMANRTSQADYGGLYICDGNVGNFVARNFIREAANNGNRNYMMEVSRTVNGTRTWNSIAIALNNANQPVYGVANAANFRSAIGAQASGNYSPHDWSQKATGSRDATLSYSLSGCSEVMFVALSGTAYLGSCVLPVSVLHASTNRQVYLGGGATGGVNGRAFALNATTTRATRASTTIDNAVAGSCTWWVFGR